MVELFEALEGEIEGGLKERFVGAWNEQVARQVEEGEECGVDFVLLKEIVAQRNEEGRKERVYLHELMKGSSFQKRPEEVLEKDPVLVARLEKMRHAVENRLYAKMVENVSNEWVKRREEVSRAEMKTGLDTAKLALNLIVSVIAVFAAAYWIMWVSYGDVILAISLATFAAIAIFMVEIILFVLRGSILDSKVSQITQDIATGSISPFPPAAPSILAAEAEQRRINRINSKKGKNKDTLHDNNNALPSPSTPLILDGSPIINNPFDTPSGSKVLSLDDFSSPPANSSHPNDPSSLNNASDFSTSIHKNAKHKKKKRRDAEEISPIQDESLLLPQTSGGATLEDD